MKNRPIRREPFTPISYLFVSLLLLATGMAPGASTPAVEDSGFVKAPPITLKGASIAAQKRTIVLMTGANVVYNLNVRIGEDPRKSGKELPEPFLNSEFPRLGDSTAASTGWSIGVQGRKGSWYSSGTFGFLQGSRSLTKGLPKSLLTGTSANEAWVQGIWDSPDGDITATFVGKEDDDRLFMRVHRDFVGKNFFLRLNALPGHVKAESALPEERWVSTASKNFQQSAGQPAEERIPAGDNWMVIFDKNTNKYRGVCAVLFDPEEVDAGFVWLGTMVAIRLSFPEDSTDARLILWHMDEHYKTPEEAYDNLKDHQAQLLEELRKMKFPAPNR